MGAYYHVLNRGIERRAIFRDEADYTRFLELCSQLKMRYGVVILCYCLMPNHYHLFLRTSLANLHKYMQELNGQYAQFFNHNRRRIGPLFQGRYKAILVQNDAYALDIARYIHLNPVKARLVRSPEKYKWSSYSEYLGLLGSDMVETALILGQFGGSIREKARLMGRFTLDGLDDGYEPAEKAKGGVIVGESRFLEWLKREKLPRRKNIEFSRLKELQKPGQDVKESMMARISGLTEDGRLAKKLLVYGLKRSTPMTLTEIAKMTGMASMYGVSQTIRRLGIARKTDRQLDATMSKLERVCRAGQ